MRPKEDVSWLDIGLGKDGRFTICDHGRLARILKTLTEPERKMPALCAFLGGDGKDSALRQVFPRNNIKRHRSASSICLRYDIATIETECPILFVDGDPQLSPRLGVETKIGENHSVMWEAESAKWLLRALWARLVFLFTDVIYIFADDFPEFSDVIGFLADCLAMQSASSLPLPVRPHIVIVLASHIGNLPEQLRHQLSEVCPYPWTDTFASISMIALGDRCLCEEARHEKLRSSLLKHLNNSQAIRRDYKAALTARHLQGLFQLALNHTVRAIDLEFNFIKASRQYHPVPRDFASHLVHFYQVGISARYSDEELAPTIASAILMDHYIPGSLVSDARTVFTTLYRLPIYARLKDLQQGPSRSITNFIELIGHLIVDLFERFQRTGISTVDLRTDQLLSQHGHLCRIQTTQICLHCLFRKAQHSLGCGHTLCDHCAQLFGTPSLAVDYRFTISRCIICLYTRPLVVDVLPPTMNPTILAIDGGGVRGVIPLEFLLLIQESLGPGCPIQELIDLAIGTSSGGLSTLGMFKMGWDVKTCSKKFDRMARRIFHKKQDSILSRISGLAFRRGSPFAVVHKWLLWLLYDGCYDGRTFDLALKSVFGEKRRLFEPLIGDSRTSLFSSTRIGVVATSIAKETRSFIFGNFNSSEQLRENCGVDIVRPANAHAEPFVWQAARATAAAPFFFTPADIRYVGSFQDGGLRDNFAAGIARRLVRQIWPLKKHPARLLSLGTGATVQPSNQVPHFRHVFRDSFIRRGFDAWMSSMDTEPKWLEMISQLDDTYMQDYFRFNVQLNRIPDSSGIDNTDAMEDYRDLVLLQAGSARFAREIATAFLISRFYLVLDGIPDDTQQAFWCHATIRCKGDASRIITALERLQTERMEFTASDVPIGRFGGLEDICEACRRYHKSVSMRVHHADETIDVFLRRNQKKKWRINGFPNNIRSHISAANIGTPLGRLDHDRPGIAPCSACDPPELTVHGKRRKRKTEPCKQPTVKRVRFC